ncbi:CCA tRNA nucleotidyltransferase [Metabacillus sp. RGM 3146]|uniref:CCA tRNA nucleotidyltransferase n=1 Tax=Metabacillus sp. RGM 3146 TaxID=3401092 RepID=UPI003B9C0836
MEPVFQIALPILKRLKQEGFQAFFVGGSVRDHLLKRQIGDIDIATSAKPGEVQRLFPKTVDVGSAHGTVIVLFNGVPYEVTTFRSEQGYKDFRRPETVTFIESISEDLKRRDFTINAMAMEEDGRIIDYFNSRKDLNDRIIRTVGRPEERFSEDALRMMRACRFVSQLGFTLSEDTKKGVMKKRQLLQNISVERKLNEFDKLLAGEDRDKAFSLLLETGMEEFLPSLHGKREALKKFTIQDKHLLTSSDEIWTLLLYFLSPENESEFLRNWKMPVKRIKHLLHTFSVLKLRRKLRIWTNSLLYHAGLESAKTAEKVNQVINGKAGTVPLSDLEKQYADLAIHNREELAITGHDLIEWSQKKPGKWMSEILMSAEEKVLEQEISNTKIELKEWFLTCINPKLD